MKLETEIKAFAQENGAALVGIASQERLVDAPPSANPNYMLPSARSIISFAIPLDRKIIRDFLSKKEWLALGADQKRTYRKLMIIADKLAALNSPVHNNWAATSLSR